MVFHLVSINIFKLCLITPIYRDVVILFLLSIAYAGFIHVVLPFLFIFHCALVIVSAILKKKKKMKSSDDLL